MYSCPASHMTVEEQLSRALAIVPKLSLKTPMTNRSVHRFGVSMTICSTPKTISCIIIIKGGIVVLLYIRCNHSGDMHSIITGVDGIGTM